MTIGEPVPDFAFVDETGTAVTAMAFRNTITVVTFATPATPQGLPYLGRIDDTFDRLGPDAAGFTRLLVELPGGVAPARPRPGWRHLQGDSAASLQLAERFGVVRWRGSGAMPGQNFVVGVVGPEGKLRARFGGLDTWTAMELLNALALAASLGGGPAR